MQHSNGNREHGCCNEVDINYLDTGSTGVNLERNNARNSNLINTDGKESNPKHPYQNQLAQFEPTEWQLEERQSQMYLQLEESKLTMIDSLELLEEMMVKLKQVTEFAIDVEHHSYRSYQGLVCLIQISTRTEDFIVDSLILKENLSVLKEICADRSILKVLHGSDADILWLQRDFGVYIVNMFDTLQAARILKEEKASLAHLLKQYCNVDVQKQYQLADWRIRPLPDEMINYAREDAHYLLYIYDTFRNKLLHRSDESKNLLRAVYKKSAEICSVLYIKRVFQPDSYIAAYKKFGGNLTEQQRECFRLLYAWRDKISFQEDESTGYTLPNKMMFLIAQQLPSTPEGIIACCCPMPPLVYENIAEIHTLVTEAINFVPDADIPCIKFVPDADIPCKNTVLQGIEQIKLYTTEERLSAIKMVNQLFRPLIL